METKLNINDKKGIFTALLTPFDKNNKINAKALEELIKFNVKMGVNGFYVTGSTGEAFLLSTEERKEVMDIVKATAPDKVLIAHVGSVSEATAIELGEYAKKLQDMGYESPEERIIQVGAGIGDRVLLATGTVASRYCMDAPVDAAVVAIVDPIEN